MKMIKEALQYLISLGKSELHDIGGQVYASKDLYAIESPTTKELEVKTLSAVVDYIKSQFDAKTFEEMMIHVESPTLVSVYSHLNADMNRSLLLEAKPIIPKFDFDRFYDTEAFNIKLQSTFVQAHQRDVMLKVVGNIKEETVSTVGDDGVSQAVVAKAGVASVANVKVPNPVQLKPYRTFIDVEQPESEFIFRMQNGPKCALFEADGGAWKNVAMLNIKKYFCEELKQEIENGKIVVIA